MIGRASLRLKLALLLAVAPLASPALADALSEGFADPPQSARPRVWWHWMNGNVTKEGIRKDLEWMKRVGIGGLQNFDANLTTPQIVDKRLGYMTPEWKEAFRSAVALAERLDLEFAIAASPGWSETGGPWVQPKDGVKKLVWSETIVAGGRRLADPLAAPPAVTGPFQTIPFSDPLAGIEGRKPRQPPTFYADVAVLAVPASKEQVWVPKQVRTGTGDTIDATPLLDDSLATVAEIRRGTAEQPATVLITYDRPRTIRSAALFAPGEVGIFSDPVFTPVLEARVGNDWRKIADVPLSSVATTVSFAPVNARAFRIVFGPYTGERRAGLGEGAPGAIGFDIFAKPGAEIPIRIADLRLSAEPQIDRFETKAGFALARDYHALSAGVPEMRGVAPSKVIDLTKRMRPDGTLDWTPPKGSWRVIRLGYSLTGKVNHPATEEATGLEVDKLDAEAVRAYLDHYLGMYKDAAGTGMVGARGVRALLTDSTEVGAFNWTPRMIQKFKELRGYDPTPWLPTLTGLIVGSRAGSDKFLYDFRRTIAELHASEHYGTLARVAHENGLKVYGEALEDVRPSLGDDMAMRRHADVPMAAMWTYRPGSSARPTLIGDIRGAASVAHLYGQNVVAAESLTSAMSPWAFAPSDLRTIIDLEFAHGVNRPVIHTSVHQPVDDKVPGLSLAIFGQYFNRHESWAEMARPWVDYIARSSHLLQQGRNFADLLYFYGEEAPLTALHAQGPLGDTPAGYAYDFANADVLLNQLAVENGELVARSGARYKALYLGGTSRRMTLPVLRRIAALAEAGATIVGERPQGSPSLTDEAAEYRTLADRLWSGRASTSAGDGKVVAGIGAAAALAAAGVAPDFSYAKPQPDSEILFVHRRLGDGDIYYLTNRRDRSERIEARFRVTGKAPEIWRADTGRTEPASYRIEGDVTIVPLGMAPQDSVFIVFRKPATAPSLTLAPPVLRPVADLSSDWEVQFQPARGAPANSRLTTLASLAGHADAGIRYFSGIATYVRSFSLPRGVRPGEPLWLDLGAVGDLAEVRVNGRTVGTVWHAPYRIDIGQAVRPGRNQLEIRVANTWVNRLIGDAQPGAKKVAFIAAPGYRPDAPLRPSGLIGPVRLEASAP